MQHVEGKKKKVPTAMTCCSHTDTVSHNSYQIGPASKYASLNLTGLAGNTHTAAQHRGE